MSKQRAEKQIKTAGIVLLLALTVVLSLILLDRSVYGADGDAGSLVTAAAVLLAAAVAVSFAVSLLVSERSRRRISADYRELQFINSNLPGGVVKFSAEEPFGIKYVSDGFLKFMGGSRTPRGIVGNSVFDTVYHDDRAGAERSIREFLERGGNGIVKIRYRMTTDGASPMWVSNRTRLIRGDGGDYCCSIIVDVSETKDAEDALRISFEQYRFAVSQIDNVVFEYYPAKRTIIQADGKNDRFGLPQSLSNVPDELIDRAIIGGESERETRRVFAEIDSGAASASAELRLNGKNGVRWVRITMHSILGGEGRVAKAVGILADVTKEKETELRLREEENYRRTILSETLFAFEYDLTTLGITSRYNDERRSGAFYGFDRYFPFEKHWDMLYAGDKEPFYHEFAPDSLWNAYRHGVEEVRVSVRLLGTDEEWHWVDVISHFIGDSSDGLRCIVYIKDIDDRKKQELALKNRAERDSLTGIYNRAASEEMIEQILSSPSQAKTALHAFLIIDLDRFKSVNDRFGHMAGDRYLINIASALGAQFRATDIVGRLGGDEFAVFMKDISSRARAETKAAELCRVIGSINISAEGESPAYSTVSIGIAIAPEDGTTFAELYEKADRALYSVKENGRDGYRRGVGEQPGFR